MDLQLIDIEQATQYRAIKSEKIVGVKMAPEKFELSMQLHINGWRGPCTWYSNLAPWCAQNGCCTASTRYSA